MPEPTARAAGPVALSAAVTVISICISPWWNLSVSSCVALADSEAGSWKPLEDRLLATGTPKIPDASITNAATAMTHRGAAIASNAIRCSTVASSQYPRTQDRRQLLDIESTVSTRFDPAGFNPPPPAFGGMSMPVDQIASIRVGFGG